jgi:hypothetical protein
MAIIAPIYSPDNSVYRYPDQIVNPSESQKDYFISPTSKNFIFKASNGVVTYINMDFLSLDNSYFNNTAFITI